MAVEKAVLLIADIGGYTRFMTYHRMNLAHAQDTIARLLEAVIDASGNFKLAKLEGDAAFFWGPVSNGVNEKIAAMRRAFLQQRGRLVGERQCTCDSCTQIEMLRLKFVVHEGEVIKQRVKNNEELAGVDVILVHRMLKNDVPVGEYALASDAAKKHVAALGDAKEIVHNLEGIGDVVTHYVDLANVALVEPAPMKKGVAKLWAKLAFEARSLPYVLGLKEPCKDFASIPPPSERVTSK
jgi:hypothetical protein